MYRVEGLIDHRHWVLLAEFPDFADAYVFARSCLDRPRGGLNARVIEDGRVLVTFEKGA